MRTFNLIRDFDVSGVSGTGHIAEGCLFENGKAIVAWLGAVASVIVYDSIQEVERIHGHEGFTRIQWLPNA